MKSATQKLKQVKLQKEWQVREGAVIRYCWQMGVTDQVTFEHNTKESKEISNVVTRESIPGWGRNQVPMLSLSRVQFTGEHGDQGSRKAERQQVCGKRESQRV